MYFILYIYDISMIIHVYIYIYIWMLWSCSKVGFQDAIYHFLDDSGWNGEFLRIFPPKKGCQLKTKTWKFAIALRGKYLSSHFWRESTKKNNLETAFPPLLVHYGLYSFPLKLRCFFLETWCKRKIINFLLKWFSSAGGRVRFLHFLFKSHLEPKLKVSGRRHTRPGGHWYWFRHHVLLCGRVEGPKGTEGPSWLHPALALPL